VSFPLYPEYVETGLTWSPLVPKQWKLCALRHCLDSVFNGLSATQIDEGDETVPVTRIETISSGRIDLNKVGFIASSEAKERYLLRFGDVLFSNINSLNMIGHCAIYSGGVPIYAGMNLLVLRPSSDVEPRWLFWLLRSVGFRGVAESLAKPAINQASLPQSSLNGIRIMVPPKDEQIVIVSFLDQETSKIDALISEQQRLIELLKEKRQAVISHAVTKGLNPDVRMKPSGVEWLGEVPEHWEVRPIKSLAHRVFEWVKIKGLELREHTRKDFKSEIFLVS
jgi:restriction endonuclease S subunit